MRISPRAVVFELLLAAAFAAAAGTAAYYFSQRQPTAFESNVVYRIADDPLLAGAGPEAYREVALSDGVLSVALADLGESGAGPDRIAAFRQEVLASTVAGPNGEQRLRIAARGEAPDAAERRAEAVATALEAWDRSAAPAQAAQASAGLDERIANLSERIRSMQVLGSADDGEIAELVAERERLVAARQRVAEGDVPSVALERVSSGTAEAAPAIVRNVALAAAAAALLSLLLGLRRPGRRERRPTSDSASSTRSGASSRRVWKSARKMSTTRGRRGGANPPGRLLAVFPRSTDSEALHKAGAQLRASLGTLLPEASPRVVLITGVKDGRGATTVARYLAEASARRGGRILLVDADLRGPGVAAAYGLDKRPEGASTTLEWLQDPTGPQKVMSLSVGGGASVDLVPQFRPTRPAPGTAEALFEGFGEAVRRWHGYELVVVDVAPLLTVEDTRLLAAWATGVVLVTAPDWNDGRTMDEVRRALSESGARLAGTVENDAPPTPFARGEGETQAPPLRIRDAGPAAGPANRGDARGAGPRSEPS